MKNIVLKMIVYYRRNFSKPGVCRFTPSCSQYAYEAIRKEGLYRGGKKALKRVFKCNALFTPVVGTYDPVS